MKNTDLCRALGGVDEDIIERCEKAAGRKNAPLRQRIVAAVAAACLAVVLMGAGVVTSHWESVQNWIAYRWESINGAALSEEQEEVVERLTQKVGVSQTVNGVTISVEDAVIFDREIEMILSIEGMELPDDGIYLHNTEVMVNSQYIGRATYGGGYEDGVIKMPVSINFDNLGDAEDVDVSITINNITDLFDRKIYAEGQWKLNFTLEKTVFEKMELSDAEIVAEYMWHGNFGEELPQKIEESYSANGITVTVDSARVTGAKFKLLVRVDGIELPDEGHYHINLDNLSLTVDPEQCAEFKWSAQGFAINDGAFYMMLVGIPKGYKYDEPLEVTLNLFDFIEHELTGELLTDGEWKIVLELRRDIAEDEITEEKVMPITITNVELSSVGFSFDYEYDLGGYYDSNGALVGFKNVTIDIRNICALLEDGTEVYADSGSGGGHTRRSKIMYSDFYITWPAPIDIDEVAEIHIGDTVIPVK